MTQPVTHPLLRYYGAKWRLAPWIISHFPPHVCFVEPFGGTAAVLLRKDPSRFEVYNDLDDEVSNFFAQLRDRPRELLKALRYTPYSRQELETAYEPSPDPLEQARRFFIRSWQGYGGPRKIMRTGWKIQKRVWLSGRADQISEWQKAKQLMAAAQRLLHVQIEHDDALKLILRWDTPDTLFYLDPPYPAETRNSKWAKAGYTCELGFGYHQHLANLLNRIAGMAVISTRPNDGYEMLFTSWKCVQTTMQTINKTSAVECLYLSPRLVERLAPASASESSPH